MPLMTETIQALQAELQEKDQTIERLLDVIKRAEPSETPYYDKEIDLAKVMSADSQPFVIAQAPESDYINHVNRACLLWLHQYPDGVSAWVFIEENDLQRLKFMIERFGDPQYLGSYVGPSSLISGFHAVMLEKEL